MLQLYNKYENFNIKMNIYLKMNIFKNERYI